MSCKVHPLRPKARSIVQLQEQLAAQGYWRDDAALVGRAYELILRLGTCHYRSSGRTLCEHSVGVAGILAALGSRGALVAAGVAHAVYVHGDFGTILRRVDAAKRARVRAAVGEECEALLLGYAQMNRDVRNLPALRGRGREIAGHERDLLLLRLVDLLDIYGERDALYCQNVAQRREIAAALGPEIAALATELGAPALGAALARGFDAVAHAAPPAATSPPWGDGVILPASFCQRRFLATYQRLRRAAFYRFGR